MKVIWAIIGLFNNAAKGTALALWDPVDPNGEDVSRHRYGWETAHMRMEWARFSMPNPDVLHLGSNIWVEWFEQPVNAKMHLRRGVKMLSALWLWSTVCAFVLGALIF